MKFDVSFSSPRALKTFYLKTQFLEKILRRSIISFIYIYIWFLKETFVFETKWRNFLTYMNVHACINRNIYIFVKCKFFWLPIRNIFTIFYMCYSKNLRFQSVWVNSEYSPVWIRQYLEILSNFIKNLHLLRN